MPKKLFWENGGILCFGGSQQCFPGEIVHLKITAEKNLFRYQFGNHITTTNELGVAVYRHFSKRSNFKQWQARKRKAKISILTLMGFLCVTQSHTINRTAVARNCNMDKFWKRLSGLKCILLAWKPLLKVIFCVIIAWEIPSDVKIVFCYCWVGISCEYGRCHNINQ